MVESDIIPVLGKPLIYQVADTFHFFIREHRPVQATGKPPQHFVLFIRIFHSKFPHKITNPIILPPQG